jgi:hypothetical protein
VANDFRLGFRHAVQSAYGKLTSPAGGHHLMVYSIRKPLTVRSGDFRCLEHTLVPRDRPSAYFSAYAWSARVPWTRSSLEEGKRCGNRERPTRASAAVQGDRPTINAGLRQRASSAEQPSRERH